MFITVVPGAKVRTRVGKDGSREIVRSVSVFGYLSFKYWISD